MDPVVIFWSILLTVLIYKFINKKSRYQELIDKIPEPPALPIFGHLFEMTREPEIRFKKFRQRCLTHYPLFKIRMANKCIVQIVKPEDIEILLKNMKHIAKGEFYNFLHSWLGTGLLTSTGAKWQSRRKILTPAFHFTILQEFIEIFNEESEELVKNLEANCENPIDVIQPITAFTLKSITETSMGLDLNVTQKQKENYKSAVYRIGQLITARMSRPWLYSDKIYGLTSEGKECKETIKTLHEFSRNVIEERKKAFDINNYSYSERKRLAMLDLLLKYQHEGANIDEEGIREEVDTFMFEGHDTTSMALCYTLLCLANYKETQEKILEEIENVIGARKNPNYAQLQELKYTERVLKECLRLYPSVPLIARLLGEEMETTSGYTLPKDSSVLVCIYDLHHNPNVFPDPEKFDPDRFLPENIQKRHPFAYIPFSAGARNCIGQKFALLELKAAVCAIVRKFVLEPIDKREDIVLVSDMVLRSKGPIRVKFVPRH